MRPIVRFVFTVYRRILSNLESPQFNFRIFQGIQSAVKSKEGIRIPLELLMLARHHCGICGIRSVIICIECLRCGVDYGYLAGHQRPVTSSSSIA